MRQSSDSSPGPRWAAPLPLGASAPEYVAYHDDEWGRPVRRRPRPVREALPGGVPVRPVLDHDPAQARGLPGRLRRFEIDRVAAFGPATSSGCWPTPGSSATGRRSTRRSRTPAPRSSSAIRRVAREPYVVVRTDEDRPAPRTFDDVPSTTEESKALPRELKRRGFRFVGPTTAYALMQACGLVNDHLAGCAVPRPGRGGAAAPV